MIKNYKNKKVISSLLCFISFFIIIILVHGCDNSRQIENDRIKKAIIGEWDYIIPNSNFGLSIPIYKNKRIIFLNDSIYEDSDGFYEKDINNKSILVDAIRKYKIENQALLDYNEKTSEWESNKIMRCDKDSLFIESNEKVSKFSRVDPKLDKSFDFDKIVLNTYPCFGGCPVGAISISLNGDVYIQKINTNLIPIEKKFYISKASNKLIENIKQKVYRANIPFLKKNYRGTGYVYNITLTFFKKGKAKKTITDMGSASTKELFWLYNYLSNFDQLLKLKEVNRNDFLKSFEILDYNTIENLKNYKFK